MIVALGLGVVIGALLGLLGGGGSILAVPALVYAVGQPLSAAVPTSLIVVGLSSATAVLPRLRQRGQIAWRIAGVFGAAGTARPSLERPSTSSCRRVSCCSDSPR